MKKGENPLNLPYICIKFDPPKMDVSLYHLHSLKLTVRTSTLAFLRRPKPSHFQVQTAGC